MSIIQNVSHQRKEFFRYVLLNVCGMLGLSCYILADTYFIAKGLGVNGLTALNLAIPVFTMVHGCGMMLGMGGATQFSIFRAQQDDKKGNQIFTNTIYLMALLSGIFVIMGCFFSGTIARVLGANTEVYTMTKTYLQMILLFSPAFLLNDIMICFVRNDGNPRLSMTAMLTGSGANILLDYIFLFSLNMGIFGAVLATCLAPVIGVCILFRHTTQRKNHFKLLNMRFSLRWAQRISSLGLPSLVTEAASGIVMLVFNMIFFRLSGNIGVAAYGVVANLWIVIVSIHTGIAQGMQPITSKAYGQGDTVSFRRIFRYALIFMLVLSILLYFIILFFAGPIAAGFNSEGNAGLQTIAVDGLRLYFLAIPFTGFNTILSMLFASMECALKAQLISIMRGLLIILPAAIVLSALAGMTGIWLSCLITEGIVAIFGGLMYRSEVMRR